MATNDDTAPTFSHLYESALAKFTAVAAIAHLLSNDDGTDQVLIDAANHAWQLAHDGAEIMPQLWRRVQEEFERKATASAEPREWTGSTAEAECRALGARILELPDYAVGQVRDFALYVDIGRRSKDGEINIDEIRDMLERGTPINSIVSFAYLKSKGVAVHSPAASEPAEPKKDLHEQIVEEIREEYPDADGEELLLRVAIREHVGVAMSPYEEDETYKRLSKVVKLIDA